MAGLQIPAPFQASLLLLVKVLKIQQNGCRCLTIFFAPPLSLPVPLK